MRDDDWRLFFLIPQIQTKGIIILKSDNFQFYQTLMIFFAVAKSKNYNQQLHSEGSHFSMVK